MLIQRLAARQIPSESQIKNLSLGEKVLTVTRISLEDQAIKATTTGQIKATEVIVKVRQLKLGPGKATNFGQVRQPLQQIEKWRGLRKFIRRHHGRVTSVETNKNFQGDSNIKSFDHRKRVQTRGKMAPKFANNDRNI